MNRRSLRALSIDSGAQLAGAVIPAILMILVFPMMARALSPTQFSTFTILFTMMSLLGVADAGLGRTVTFYAARALETGDEEAALASLAGGILFGAVFSVLAWLLIQLAITLLPAFSGANVNALQIMSAALPLFILSGMLRGYLEARFRFVTVNFVQLLFGCSVSILPVLLVSRIDDMGWFAALFGTLKLLQCAGYAALVARAAGGARPSRTRCRRAAFEIFRYVRWLIVSNLVGIAIFFSDRAVVASSFTPRQIAAYIVPMEVILRGQVLFAAVSAAAFPRLVTLARAGHQQLLSAVFALQAALGGLLLAASAVLFPFVPAALELWMGPVFSADATYVVIAAILGVVSIGIANVAVVVLNASGQTATPAYVHMAELPFYLIALWYAVHLGKVDAIATAWLARIIVDMLAMQWMLLRGPAAGRLQWLAFLAATFAFALFYIPFVARLGEGSATAWFSLSGVVMGTALAATAWRRLTLLRKVSAGNG